jgi:aryl-alcohol dehydrogenase-like predicted oxidoreductase
MRFRIYKNADLTVSEVGFGLWTVSTGWWGNFTEGEAIALMHKAFDLGITLFDAADTYGNGLSEELIAKAFPNQRDEIVIATKIGYDFVSYGEARGRGQREIPQDFSPEAIARATDAALKRLKTDRIDLLQLHNIRMEQVYDDALWKTLEKLKAEGKVRYYGIALGVFFFFFLVFFFFLFFFFLSPFFVCFFSVFFFFFLLFFFSLFFFFFFFLFFFFFFF